MNTPAASMPVTGTAYLMETENGLHLLDADGLTKFLHDDIEYALRDGDAPAAVRIYRYASPGHLSELTIVRAAHWLDDDDYLHTSYALHEKADADGFGATDENKVLEFTVSIDGRV